MKKLVFLLFIIIISVSFPVSAQSDEQIYIATIEGKLALHISPDENSEKVTTVPACTEVTLLETKGTWGLVTFENKSGWISLSFTRKTYNKAAEATGFDSVRTVKVQSQKTVVPLYSLPSSNSTTGSVVKYSIPTDVVLTIIRETTTGWGLVSMSGEYAWIDMHNTSKYQTETQKTISKYEIYYVYALSPGGAGVNMYADNGTNNVVAIIPECTQLTVREIQGDYAYVAYNGINGWIPLKYTTKSLFHSQLNTGEKIHEEYITDGKYGKKKTNIHSVPTDREGEYTVIGSINADTYVFVQRRTRDGWCLINHNGVIGWIHESKIIPVEKETDTELKILNKKEEAYLTSDNDNGTRMYSDADMSHTVTYIPECVKVRIMAEKNDMKYIFCDYASGWVENRYVVDSYSAALENSVTEDKREYTLKKDTLLMNIPAMKGEYGSNVVANIKEGRKVQVMRIVSMNQKKWGLIEIDGQKGWINLEDADIKLYVYEIIMIIIGGFVLIVVTTIVIVLKMRKKAKRKVIENE